MYILYDSNQTQNGSFRYNIEDCVRLKVFEGKNVSKKTNGNKVLLAVKFMKTTSSEQSLDEIIEYYPVILFSDPAVFNRLILVITHASMFILSRKSNPNKPSNLGH